MIFYNQEQDINPRKIKNDGKRSKYKYIKKRPSIHAKQNRKQRTVFVYMDS